MNKKIKFILFLIVFIIGIFMIPTLGQASSNVKSILQIDTNLNNAVFDKTGIHIEGWKLADISNTKLKVYIDGKEVSSEYIKYSYKYDLISIVKGYGTYKENPTPMYSINIPTNNIINGTHILKIQIVSNSGEVLKNVENKITVQKIKYVYNIDTDLTCNSINLTTAINTSKTDSRLVKILKSVKLSIQDEKNSEIKSVEITDISKLSTEEGIKSLIETLKSNTTYNIVLTAKAMQGSTEADVQVSYTLRKFLTNKLPARINISNVVVTTSVIDMDVYIEDIDKSCLEDIVNIRMLDSYDKEYIPTIEPKEIKSSTKIPTNQWVRLTYDGLTENETFTLSAEVASYNETNDVSKVQNNFVIDKTQFVTTGLGGKIDLVGMERQMKQDGSNLVDVKSENNWYSKCFDAFTSDYTLDESYTAKFKITPKYNYGKTYTEDDNSITLNLLSKQCYVYDLSKYAGQTVTMSFSAKVTEANAKVYIQKGKDIGKNLEQITGLGTGNLTSYTKTFKVPDDGYVGFYLEKYEETIPPPEDDENAEPTIKEKDYVTNPKKSGYSAYHIILGIPVVLSQQIIYVKVEVQIRTMAMDFWASLEHKMKYKNNKDVSKNVSKELVQCAKIVNKLDNKMLLLNS